MVNLEMVRTGSAMPVQSIPLASGDAGVAQTIRAMRRLIDQGKKDPQVHEAAAHIIRSAGVPAFDFAGEVRAVYQWVLGNIRFTRDVYGKETLHAAPEILRLQIGDCDDFTILLCSLLGTIGHKTRILTISKPEDQRNFSHVFPQVLLNGSWVTIDAARRGAAIGRNPERTDRVRIWDTASDDFVDVEGLGNVHTRVPRSRGMNGLRGMWRAPGVRATGKSSFLEGAAGRNPNALPGAYPAGVADPRFRSLRGHTLRGLGRYGAAEVRRALSGMGDDGFDWSSLAPIIQAGETGAANIIAATRASPYNLFPTTAIGAPQQRPLTTTSLLTTGAPGTIGGISTGTLLLGGLGILAVAMIAGERR